jgi:hypothetical protein
MNNNFRYFSRNVAYIYIYINKQRTPWALVRKRTILTERLALVGEIQCQLLRIEGCRVVSAVNPPRSLISVFLSGVTTFLSSSSSFMVTSLRGTRSRPTATQKIW